MSAVSIIDGRLGFETQSNQNQQFLKCIFTASLLTLALQENGVIFTLYVEDRQTDEHLDLKTVKMT